MPDSQEEMVACDCCDTWYHFTCTGFDVPPPGDWFCKIALRIELYYTGAIPFLMISANFLRFLCKVYEILFVASPSY